MKISISLSRDGIHYNARLVPDAAAALFATAAACEYLMKEMERIGAVCQRCRIVARQSELTDGICATGTGCDTDSDRHVYLTVDQFDQKAQMTQLSQSIWRSYISNMPKGLDDAAGGGPPRAEGELW